MKRRGSKKGVKRGYYKDPDSLRAIAIHVRLTRGEYAILSMIARTAKMSINKVVLNLLNAKFLTHPKYLEMMEIYHNKEATKNRQIADLQAIAALEASAMQGGR